MQTHDLVPHPAFPPLGVVAIRVRIDERDAKWLTLRWRVEGAARIVVPPLAGRVRRDGLWRTTCFEFFVRPADRAAYSEWNFSPSQAWAAYDFASYRDGMAERDCTRMPVTAWRGGASGLRLMDVAIPKVDLPAAPSRYGLSAVIEETGGQFSYWALAHPAAKPDFHDPACFTGMLAAPPGP